MEMLEHRLVLSTFSVINADDGGVGSLRWAIEEANANVGHDSIAFDESLIGQPIVLGGTELTVIDDLSITGLGADKLTISGNDASRVFSVDTSVTVEISDMTITGGASDAGGAIYNAGTLSIRDSRLSQNNANYGGAICSNGVLKIGDSVLSDNRSTGHGGAIGHSGDTLTIASTTFSQNDSVGSGGAIDLWTHGTTTITDSTFSNNQAGNYGGAIENLFSTLIVTNSALLGNSVRYGGAIDSSVGAVQLTNSTISGNSSTSSGGGICNYGPLKITNSTLTANRADEDGDGWGNGGGLCGYSSDALLDNTIVAGNSVGPAGTDSPNDIYGTVDPASSHNLVGDTTASGGLIDGDHGNIVGNAGSGTIDINSVLDPNLADNGGLTLTHCLVAGDPAVNTGDNSKAVDVDGNPLLYDQRGVDEEGAGFDRIVDGTVDIGAFEVQPELELVQINIKPGSDTNPINLAGKGVIAVAIMTTADFDAATVDASTVRFAEAYAVHNALEDVDGDGDLDMVLHFQVQDTNLADIYADLLADDVTEDGVLDSNRQMAAISLLGETLDGEGIVGSDEVNLFFSGKALRELLDELALAGVL